MKKLMIFQQKLGNQPVCFISLHVNENLVCYLHSYKQIILSKSPRGYVANTNGVSLYCDRIYIEGEHFTENQIIVNDSTSENVKSVNRNMILY